MAETLYELEQRLYDEALDIPSGSERQAFLENACGGDTALLNSLSLLLGSDDDADAFFADGSQTLVQLVTSMPVADPTSGVNPAIGMKIGPYEIMELIGEGGCGSVFVAEQKQPFRRRVALKIIRIGMDTQAVISRFEAERQALALMDHPNIAHVLDAGTTTSGLPYFVMELVHGSSITRYCDGNEVSVAERLRLFVKVCNAINHAHQKGVIHRDIKPSNILITLHDGQPVPKIIDFGIAKATDIPLTENALLTHNSQMIGTPAYMSPEQAERGGQELDTRSDIYSLGVLLYELLTGRPPFDPKELARSGMSELLRTLREVEPPLPSAVLAGLPHEELSGLAQCRGTDASGLLSFVAGDLDWITSKAMEKDRSRRYESAHGFAMDIGRFLAYEPVIARPPTRRYLFQKLVRRNRVVFASATMLAAILILATAVSISLYLREREARQGLSQAKQTQMALREEADRGRDQAEHLRRIAEARESITQAVVLLRDGNFPGADSLVIGIPVIRPTPEGAEVFRRLGEWHESQGRWREAAERSSYLIEVNYLDGSDTPSLDHLRTGPVLIEAGDHEGFEKFRVNMINRFARKADTLTAERTVKVVLLIPASADLMRQLDPLINASVDSLAPFVDTQSSAKMEDLVVWRMTSVALGEYRRGRFARAEFWARKCLASSTSNESRVATARIILALSLYQEGHTVEARTELDPASKMVRSKFHNDERLEENAGGWWPDWLIARILLREAEALLAKTPPIEVAR
ncbi:MAG: serine/threonine-protein kinase [Luteolibacter sp.]